MIPAWVADLIGTPFLERGRTRADGFDCWGLAREVWRHYGIEVPSYAEAYQVTSDRDEIARLLNTELPKTPWREIPATEAAPGDGVLFRIAGQPLHVGVLVAPGFFLHTDRQTGAVVDRLQAPRWARRVVGIYRYAG